LLAGRYPGGKSPKEAERRVEAFLEAGFDTFIDLTEAGELPPYDIYLPGSVQYLRKPIPDHGLPSAREHMVEIQAAIDRGRAALAKEQADLKTRAGAPPG